MINLEHLEEIKHKSKCVNRSKVSYSLPKDMIRRCSPLNPGIFTGGDGMSSITQNNTIDLAYLRCRCGVSFGMKLAKREVVQ